jgi:hypothetical protein
VVASPILGTLAFLIGFCASLGLSAFYSLYYAAIAISTLNPQLHSVAFDLVRLTLLSNGDIVAAQYATVQIRAWRAMAPEIGLRLLVVIIGFISIIGSAFFFLQDPIYRPDTTNYAPLLGFLALLLVLMCGYILEPLWRMRLITAIALTLAMRISNVTSTYLAAFLAILAIVILNGALTYGFSVGLLDATFANSADPMNLQPLTDPIIAGAIGVAIFYSYHRLIQTMSIRWAIHKLDHDG